MYYTTIITAILGLTAIYCAMQISVTDMRRRIIPDVYLFPLMLIGLIFTSFFDWIVSPAQSVAAATFAYASGMIIGVIFEKSKYVKKQKYEYPPIGMGDIKLMMTGGIWLGMTGLAIAVLFATLSGAIWSKVKKQKFIPFAPFFISGAIISLLIITFLI